MGMVRNTSLWPVFEMIRAKTKACITKRAARIFLFKLSPAVRITCHMMMRMDGERAYMFLKSPFSFSDVCCA